MSEEIAYVGETSGDNVLNVQFYNRLDEAGKDVEFVRIEIPGDKFNVIDTQVTDEYRTRFRNRYSQWKELQGMGGTPVEEWGDVPEGLRKEFAYQGFRFIEQVASAPDSSFQRIMGGFTWRKKAQQFLERGKVSAESLLEAQSAQIAELQAQMAALLGDEKKKPGRPPKAEN